MEKSENKFVLFTGRNLIIIAMILITIGYALLEFKPGLIMTLRNSCMAVLVILSVLWFLGSLCLFSFGCYLLIKQSQKK